MCDYEPYIPKNGNFLKINGQLFNSIAAGLFFGGTHFTQEVIYASLRTCPSFADVL